MSWFFLRDCKQTVSIRRAMCRACSSWKTVSDSPSQSLTARKSIALSETAPSQSASYSLKNAFFDFLNMFYTTILLANFFYSYCLIHYSNGSYNPQYDEFFTFLPKFIPRNNLLLKFENKSRIFPQVLNLTVFH